LVFLNRLKRKWSINPPALLRWAFPGTTWRESVKGKSVFLTFDDGPIPDVTPWVLQCLKEHDMVATFFCVGENIQKHPDVFQKLVESGMGIGNHTYSHKKAWRSNKADYLEDIDRFTELYRTNIFRPPHGQLYPWWVKNLKKRFSKIVMWDILTMDYDNALSADEVVKNVMDHLRPGSIIVFHDSIKSMPRLEMALPIVLDKIKEAGYTTALFNNLE
jgi:peptidoglycan/xylan/chitin deacetylase (PgdA/CDA1 family)